MLAFIRNINRLFMEFRPFYDREAWALFRTAAIAEGIGWTLLIIGIACKSLPVGWHEIPVSIAGRVHGMLFIAYIMAVLAFGSSLGWSITKTIIAGLFSAPPYGSVVFEKWEAHQRQQQHARKLYRIAWYHRFVQAAL